MAAQLPDIILLKNRKMELYTNPLEGHWLKMGKRKPNFKTTETCNRGYIATWLIDNNDLLLKQIDGEHYSSSFFFGNKLIETTLKKIFPKSGGHGVLANWYSGKLRIPAGHMTLYEHSNYNSRFEKEIIITIDKGRVLKMVTLDYTQQKLVVNLENIL